MDSENRTSLVREISFHVILIFFVGWLLIKFQVLFGPLIIAALIAYLLYPIVTWLSKRAKIDRRQIVLIVYLIFIGGLIWAAIFLVPLIIKQASNFETQLFKFKEQVVIMQTNLKLNLGINLPLEGFFSEFETDLDQLFEPDRAFGIIRSATTNIVWVIVIFLTSFHLLRDWELLREQIFSPFSQPEQTEYRKLHKDIKMVWNSYLRGQILIMIFIGILSGAGAAAIGLPSALLLGFTAGALALIPNIGPATATIIAAIVAWTQGSTYLELSNLTITLIVVGIFVVVQMIEGFWLTPRIMSRRLKIHPGVVMLAIVGTLFSLGALIALIIMPLIGSLILIVKYISRKRAGLDPWPLLEIEVINPTIENLDSPEEIPS